LLSEVWTALQREPGLCAPMIGAGFVLGLAGWRLAAVVAVVSAAGLTAAAAAVWLGQSSTLWFWAAPVALAAGYAAWRRPRTWMTLLMGALCTWLAWQAMQPLAPPAALRVAVAALVGGMAAVTAGTFFSESLAVLTAANGGAMVAPAGLALWRWEWGGGLGDLPALSTGLSVCLLWLAIAAIFLAVQWTDLRGSTMVGSAGTDLSPGLPEYAAPPRPPRPCGRGGADRR
jgi:hypothetical protein